MENYLGIEILAPKKLPESFDAILVCNLGSEQCNSLRRIQMLYTRIDDQRYHLDGFIGIMAIFNVKPKVSQT